MTYGPVRVVQVGLDVELDLLDERIDARFRCWMEEGLLDEVRALLARPGGLGRTARQASLPWPISRRPGAFIRPTSPTE